ncbi:MAG: helix-turn-helix domain-containing protein [Rickettsiales bacterium]|jgi:DNA-binding transcriptional regulator LsrR (DeoR family)|nr:helix-turn-helix domain-containing protein [Rickettsiales bacterium]
MGGRPKGISDDAKQTAGAAEALYKQNELTSDQIANKLQISKPTLYKYLKHRNVKIGLIQEHPQT